MRQMYPMRATSLDCAIVPGAFTVDGDKITLNECVGVKVAEDDGAGCYRIDLDYTFARVLSATLTVQNEKPVGLSVQIKAMDRNGLTLVTRQGGKAAKPPKGTTIHFVLVYATSSVPNA